MTTFEKTPAKATFERTIVSSGRMLTYSQMLEKALAISPEATVELDSFEEKWRIVIPTDFTENYKKLDDKFKGTYAWDSFHEYEPTYGCTLIRWMWKNGSQGSLHDGAAAYNAHVKQSRDNIDAFDKAIEEAGLESLVEKIDHAIQFTPEEATAFRAIYDAHF